MNCVNFACSYSLLVWSLSAAGCVMVGVDEGDDLDALAAAGDHTPSGPHHRLSLIGVPQGKSLDMTVGTGHRIFVPLSGGVEINLREGVLAVLDANATDGAGAFQLPDSDADADGATAYAVYARALGKLGSSSITSRCATAPGTGELVCSNLSRVVVRSTGGAGLTDVARELMHVVTDVQGDGKLERVPLFDDRLRYHFWQDASGLRVAQLQLYVVPAETD